VSLRRWAVMLTIALALFYAVAFALAWGDDGAWWKALALAGLSTAVMPLALKAQEWLR
jgi:hypothetical protein